MDEDRIERWEDYLNRKKRKRERENAIIDRIERSIFEELYELSDVELRIHNSKLQPDEYRMIVDKDENKLIPNPHMHPVLKKLSDAEYMIVRELKEAGIERHHYLWYGNYGLKEIGKLFSKFRNRKMTEREYNFILYAPVEEIQRGVPVKESTESVA